MQYMSVRLCSSRLYSLCCFSTFLMWRKWKISAIVYICTKFLLNRKNNFLIHSAGLRAKQGKESLFWNTFSDDHRAHANHRKQLLVVGYYSKWPYFFRDTPQQYKHDNTFLPMQIWTHVCNNNPLVFMVLLSFGGQLVQATLGQTIIDREHSCLGSLK